MLDLQQATSTEAKYQRDHVNDREPVRHECTTFRPLTKLSIESVTCKACERVEGGPNHETPKIYIFGDL